MYSVQGYKCVSYSIIIYSFQNNRVCELTSSVFCSSLCLFRWNNDSLGHLWNILYQKEPSQLCFTSYSSGSDTEQTLSENKDHNNTWTSFDTLVKTHRGNVKISHINANSIAGFQFIEIKNWLTRGRFDILAISETKLDKTYPDSQFAIQGFCMCQSDRNIYGGGLMIFIRSDLCFTVTKELGDQNGIDLSNFRTECMILKVKVAKSWLTVMAIYRLPSIPTSHWKFELSRLFEVVKAFPNNAICVADFNSNLLDPKDSSHLNELITGSIQYQKFD